MTDRSIIGQAGAGMQATVVAVDIDSNLFRIEFKTVKDVTTANTEGAKNNAVDNSSGMLFF